MRSAFKPVKPAKKRKKRGAAAAAAEEKEAADAEGPVFPVNLEVLDLTAVGHRTRGMVLGG